MSTDQLRDFLMEIRSNKILFEKISAVATADEIAMIASEFGFKFTGEELKAISNQNIAGVKVRKQDTTPSYNFGEGGN